MTTTKFKINGLHCHSCVKLSKESIGEIPGVKSVDIKDLQGETEVVGDREISLDEVNKSLEGTGYTAVNN